MATRTRAGRPRGRYARTTSTPRRRSPIQGMRRRREPEPSGLKKLMSSALPGGAAKKVAPSSKKGWAGGLTLVAAAAGMAIKNRGKLSERGHKGPGREETNAGSGNAAVPPSTPVV
jgi:hypothetical protein